MLFNMWVLSARKVLRGCWTCQIEKVTTENACNCWAGTSREWGRRSCPSDNNKLIGHSRKGNISIILVFDPTTPAQIDKPHRQPVRSACCGCPTTSTSSSPLSGRNAAPLSRLLVVPSHLLNYPLRSLTVVYLEKGKSGTPWVDYLRHFTIVAKREPPVRRWRRVSVWRSKTVPPPMLNGLVVGRQRLLSIHPLAHRSLYFPGYGWHANGGWLDHAMEML